MIRANLRNVDQYIAAKKEFNGSNIKGRNIAIGSYVNLSLTQLPVEYRKQLEAAIQINNVFVVYSYETPIGWCVGNQWVIPPVKYSVTTTKHQNKLPKH